MDRAPKTIVVTFILILAIAAFWFIFSIITALGGNWSLERTGSYKWILVILALGTAIFLAGLTYYLSKQNRISYYLSLVLLSLIVLFSITDQTGWIDLSFLVVTLATLALLIKDRRWYLKKELIEDLPS